MHLSSKSVKIDLEMHNYRLLFEYKLFLKFVFVHSKRSSLNNIIYNDIVSSRKGLSIKGGINNAAGDCNELRTVLRMNPLVEHAIASASLALQFFLLKR
jgi:hypothetical protein